MALIGELIAGGVALLVCLLNNHYQQKKVTEQHLKTIALIEYKLDEVTHKVELHNNAVERLFIAEGDIKVLREQAKSAHHRLDELGHQQ